MNLKRTGLVISFLLMFGFVLSGCGGGGEQATQTTQDTTDEAAESSASGNVEVTVNFNGDAPESESFDASGNPECGKDTLKGRKAVVNENGTLQNVVVSIKDAPSGLENSSPEDVTVNQVNCLYTPHTVAVKAGQTFTIKDSDDGLHNVRATQDGRQLFNKSTFKGDEKEASFDEPGVYSLECNVHPWMQGWVYVSEHGYHSVTGEEGTASLSDLPTGDYTIVTWHEEYGTKTQEVTVEEDSTESFSVSYSS